jgi:glutamate formiminotransferase/formiminotetrahydrofolate cyclodeaminase
MDQFEPAQILESKLYAALTPQSESNDQPTQVEQQKSINQNPQFLNALADGAPTPGGGSAAAYAGAMGAALVSMVARLTLGKKKFAEVQEQMLAILDEAELLRKKLTAAVEEDAAAFEGVMTAFRLPKDTDDQIANRAETIRKATLHAAGVPLETARLSVRVMGLACQVAQIGNLNAVTDAGTGVALAQAAITGAGYNVRINILDLGGDEAELLISQLEQLENSAAQFNDDLQKTLRERGGLTL